MPAIHNGPGELYIDGKKVAESIQSIHVSLPPAVERKIQRAKAVIDISQSWIELCNNGLISEEMAEQRIKETLSVVVFDE
ncbi:hypothetical protein [Terribacillus sp. JSM ZJ617]|uniref:hypothetical protein n=1 Tax=Terribacillus sp. JSM ZJ617 TaxID=3342119 RepID=UPI0035A91261